MPPFKELLLATHNTGKITELERRLTPLGIVCRSARDMALPDVEETGETFAENAVLKAETAMRATGLPSLADDSGLRLDALGGRPGVHTARTFGTVNGAPYIANLLRALADFPDPAQRTAQAVAVLALAIPGDKTYTFEGIAPGTILTEPATMTGFGFDPLFMPDGQKSSPPRTYSAMTKEEKNEISHRGKALDQLIQFLS